MTAQTGTDERVPPRPSRVKHGTGFLVSTPTAPATPTAAATKTALVDFFTGTPRRCGCLQQWRQPD